MGRNNLKPKTYSGYLVLPLIKGEMRVVFPPRPRLVQLQYRLVLRSRVAPEELDCCRILVSVNNVILVHRRGTLWVFPSVFLPQICLRNVVGLMSPVLKRVLLLLMFLLLLFLLLFQTSPSWVLPERVNRFRYFTSSIVLVSLLDS